MKLLKIITLLLFITGFFSQSFAIDGYSYSRVVLKVKNNAVFKLLAQHHIHIDHPTRTEDGIMVVLNNEELSVIKSLDIEYKVLIEDLEKHYEDRFKKELKDPEYQKMMKTNAAGFGLGNHAGYYTPPGVWGKLNEIANNYPNIAAQKVNIGKTYEGRNIFMLKISDNPDVDESATEPAVYYDSMHHAREPLSMMTTLYYMFWLVENYGIDPVATHLVNNRELYFVPIVNVDGYAYNISSNTFGGGLWRKNMRPDPNGSGCIGTDPNRNYDINWSGPGASSYACSETYHGDAAFSEPCTQAVRDLLLSINPVTAFTSHSAAEIYLESDWEFPVHEHYFADYSLDFCEGGDFAYGQGNDILYETSGGTAEYLSSLGAIAYTPEIGSEFWEPASQIFHYVEKHLPTFIYIASVAGDYPDIKQAIINNDNSILPGQSYPIDVELYNKGITHAANEVTVEIVNHSPNITVMNGLTSIASVEARQMAWSSDPLNIIISASASAGDIVEVELSVVANGIEYERETQRWIVGAQNVLFAENGDNGLGGFYSSGSTISWDTTYVMKRSGNECLADSPLGAAYNNSTSYMNMSAPISLSGTLTPRLEYWIAWGVSNFNAFQFYSDPYDDHARIEMRQNGGNWFALSTDDTQYINGGPRYVLNHGWAKQIVDLSAYVGSEVEFRFVVDASDFSKPDGVFIDDFRIVDYSTSAALPVAVIDNDATLEICEGESITVSHSSTNYNSVSWSSGDGSDSAENETTFTYNQPGVYTLTLEASNANGADTSSLTVIVNASTPVTIIDLPESVNIVQPINLSAIPEGGIFTGNSVAFNMFNPSIAGVGLHTITYTYVNENGCTSTASNEVLVYTVSFNFVNYNLNTISPKIINTIDFEIEVPIIDEYTFDVFDVQGRPVYSETSFLQQGTQQRSLNLNNNLTPGMYFIQITNSEGTVTEKFIR